MNSYFLQRYLIFGLFNPDNNDAKTTNKDKQK